MIDEAYRPSPSSVGEGIFKWFGRLRTDKTLQLELHRIELLDFLHDESFKPTPGILIAHAEELKKRESINVSCE